MTYPSGGGYVNKYLEYTLNFGTYLFYVFADHPPKISTMVLISFVDQGTHPPPACIGTYINFEQSRYLSRIMHTSTYKKINALIFINDNQLIILLNPIIHRPFSTIILLKLTPHIISSITLPMLSKTRRNIFRRTTKNFVIFFIPL